MATLTDQESFLSDTAALFGETSPEDGSIKYGPLTLTTAPKEGKVNTLLADHLFSPSLLLSEFIERGIIDLARKTVVELGAGCALPSLLSATLGNAPSVAVITDYPDEIIMNNLSENVNRNRNHYNKHCLVHSMGYEWGQNIGLLLCDDRCISTAHSATNGLYGRELLPRDAASTRPEGFDAVIMSDLLHFDRSHDVLLLSLSSLLRRDPASRAYVAAGKYTKPRVCEQFVQEARRSGIILEEGEVEGVWLGTLEVSGGGLDKDQLGARKDMCRWWIGRWVDPNP